MNAQTEDAKDKLWLACQAFIKAQRIHCPETIYQTDRVVESACELVETVCGIVGYEDVEGDE